MSETASADLTWFKVVGLDELPEGRVKSVTVAKRTFAVTHHDAALV